MARIEHQGGAAERALVRDFAVLRFEAGDEAHALTLLQSWAAGSTTPAYDRLDLERDAPALAARFWGGPNP